ncbi:50S ribosomal protein L29 [Candidatus Woesearchaeota archaeon]|nr:50S ribosomal protein L29 [Candidatus Woesearchaeota archaeon]
MTKKAHAELKKKNPDELQRELSSARLELLKLNAQVATGGAAKEAGKITMLKKKVARIKTLQTKGGNESR